MRTTPVHIGFANLKLRRGAPIPFLTGQAVQAWFRLLSGVCLYLSPVSVDLG